MGGGKCSVCCRLDQLAWSQEASHNDRPLGCHGNHSELSYGEGRGLMTRKALAPAALGSLAVCPQAVLTVS